MMRRGRDESNSRFGVAKAGNLGRHFVPRQLASFTGFGTLGHFDLQFIGGMQIGRSHPEAPTGHLFDGGIAGGVVPLNAFSSLPGVGVAPHQRHGLSQGFVGFFGKSPMGHSRGDEAAHNGFGRFYVRQEHRSALHEGQQVADVGNRALLDGLQITIPLSGASGPSRPLEGQHHTGTGDMELTSAPLLVKASGVLRTRAVEGMQTEGVPGQMLKSSARQPAGGVREGVFEHLVIQTQSLE